MDLLDLVLPRRYAVCRLPGVELCTTCHERLKRLRCPLCARCGAPTAWPVARCRECSGRRLAFASARAAIAYDRSAALFVAAWKEQALRRLAEAAADLVAEVVTRPDTGLLTFVPADGERGIRRGHHPAERLAYELSLRWDVPLEALLARTGRSERQRGLPLSERRKNVAGAFRPKNRVPTRIVLVDDVYTTGSTATAAASALRKNGARIVDVVAFARAVRGIR